MHSLPLFLAPFALLLPFGVPLVADVEARAVEQVRTDEQGVSALPLSDTAPAWDTLYEGIGPSSGNQVRIERRVVLRISPAPGPVRQDLTAQSRQAQPRQRIVERPAGSCVQSASIGAIKDRPDYLLIFLRDRRTLAARLEKGCSPRDFYLGAYLEPNEDGKICVDRDRLMSRSGAKCQVDSFRELVVETVD